MIDKTRCDSGGGAAKSKGCTERRFSLFIKEEVITALGQYLDQMLHKKSYFLSTVIICEKKCISSGMGKSLIIKVL